MTTAKVESKDRNTAAMVAAARLDEVRDILVHGSVRNGDLETDFVPDEDLGEAHFVGEEVGAFWCWKEFRIDFADVVDVPG